MYTLNDLPVDLALYDTIKHGGAPIRNMTQQLGETWRRSKRNEGGDWVGTGTWKGDPGEMADLFLDGIMYELRETVGGEITWRGFIGEMALMLKGSIFVRKWSDIANKVKCIYTHIGANQFTNGSAESGAWTSYNTPSTNEQSTVWRTHGTYSDHIVSNSANDGATIQSGITILAEKGYDCHVVTNLVSGTWVLEVYRTDTGAKLYSSAENEAGQRIMEANIPDSNDYAGDIGVRLYETSGTGEIYADNAVFQEAGVRAETSWYEDIASQAEYGIMEEALLEGSLHDEAANGMAQTELYQRAWPRTWPPDEFKDVDADALGENPEKDQLKITVYGDVFLMRNTHTIISGVDYASNHVSALVGESEFITAGAIESNTMDFQIEDRAPLRLWEVLQEITRAGDANGRRWTCGVWGQRKFDYGPADTSVRYRYRGGRLLGAHGGWMEPWYALPGMVYVDDLPAGPGQISGQTGDDPRVFFIEEVEFDAAEWLKTGYGLRFKRETR